VFEPRGEILTVSAEKGDARNLTRTPGPHERWPAWSPDGKWIARRSSEQGEYALYLSVQNGRGEPKEDRARPCGLLYPADLVARLLALIGSRRHRR
jgi:tricorn protease